MDKEHRKNVRSYFVYMHTSRTSNKSYIGVTSQKVEDRWTRHIKDSKCKDWKFSRAIRKYGVNDFKCLVLAKTYSKKVALDLEKYFIDMMDTYRGGYNSTKGGEGRFGLPHTEETKIKISKAHKGKKYSEERRRKMSELSKGREQGEKERRLKSEAMIGERNHQFGLERTNIHRQRLSNSCKGKKIPLETKLKMSMKSPYVWGDSVREYKSFYEMSLKHKYPETTLRRWVSNRQNGFYKRKKVT